MKKQKGQVTNEVKANGDVKRVEIELQKKDAGTQTEIIPKDYVSPKVLSIFSLESEAFPKFLYQPHLIFLLILGCGMLIYFGFHLTRPLSETSFITNSQLGFLAASATIIYFTALYFPNSYIQRPHPVFWRILLGWSLCYVSVLIYILFQNREDINFFLQKFIDPKLGVPLPEKSYAADCRFYTPENPESNFYNFKDALDMYISAHFFGWLVKMLIVRNWKFCMFLSIFFEFLELTFRHWLPNFHECWWDHLILDVILCNGGGILAGHLLIKAFQLKKYRWSRQQENKNNILTNFSNFVRYTSIESQEWHMFSSASRFFYVIYYICLVNLTDLANFFMKFVLWLPSTHYVLAIRIFLVGFLSIIATREYHEYITNEKCKRMGPYVWIFHLIVVMEWAIVFKFKNGYFTEPFPQWIVIAWTLILLSCSTIYTTLLYRDVRKKFFPTELEILQDKEKDI
jgi:phosphatidylserine synthase 2